MTAKEKAWELFRKFKNIPDKWKNEKVFQNYYAKQCALIAVAEIIDVCSQVEPWLGLEYWQEVKSEIEKL